MNRQNKHSMPLEWVKSKFITPIKHNIPLKKFKTIFEIMYNFEEKNMCATKIIRMPWLQDLWEDRRF